MIANLVSSAAVPVRKIQIDIIRVFLSTIAMWPARKLEIPCATLALEPEEVTASTLCEPARPVAQHAVEIIEEAFRCECMPGMALETVLDHVRSRR